MKPCALIATSSFGLEKVVKRELQELGFAECRITDGQVTFDATLDDIPRLNIRLRAADRVLVKLAEFPAKDFDDVFAGVSRVKWSDWIPRDAKLTVLAAVTRSEINSARSSQSIVKKAIVQQLKAHYRVEWLKESGPEFTVKLTVTKDIAMVTLDTSGEGLHKRGYRQEPGEAPMRENLAAALVLLSFWNRARVLIDPMCGSGTILIEAAMIARDIAPGVNRRFAAESWPSIAPQRWEDARAQARQAVHQDTSLKIFGYDSDRRRVEDSKINANNAGVLDDIIFQQGDAKQLTLDSEHGIMISNPPYGVGIGTERELDLLYKSLNNIFRDRPDWSLYLITADKRFPQFFKRAQPDRVRKLYNGNIEAHYYQYYGTRPPRKQTADTQRSSA